MRDFLRRKLAKFLQIDAVFEETAYYEKRAIIEREQRESAEEHYLDVIIELRRINDSILMRSLALEEKLQRLEHGKRLENIAGSGEAER